MPSKLRSHLTVANVLSAVALFVALGGTSYAISANTIGSKQIKNGSIQSADIGNGKVAGKDIKNGSLTSGDIANGKLAGRDLKKGTLTAANFAGGVLPKGPKGDKGEKGAAGGTTVHLIYGPVVVCSADGCRTPAANATCPAGEHLVGGGAFSDADDALVVSAPTIPAVNPTTWQSQAQDLPGGATGANARSVALCTAP